MIPQPPLAVLQMQPPSQAGSSLDASTSPASGSSETLLTEVQSGGGGVSSLESQGLREAPLVGDVM